MAFHDVVPWEVIGKPMHNPTVNERPSFDMRDWAIFEIHGTRHVLGRVPAEGNSRVSSPIVSFDPVASVAVTSTGRRYNLPPDGDGLRMESLHVLYQWLGLNGFEEKDLRYVTQEYVPEDANASSEEGEGST